MSRFLRPSETSSSRTSEKMSWSLQSDQVICKEGEEADAFYLIRSGMVRVSQNMPGGEMVRTYLSRGDFFGEIGLLRSIKRIATCTALDAVDVVKVPGSEFNLMLEKFPGVRAQLEPVADARMAVTKARTAPPGLGICLSQPGIIRRKISSSSIG